MKPFEPVRVLQFFTAEKQAEFAQMSAADRLAWLDEVRALYFSAAAARAIRDPGATNIR